MHKMNNFTMELFYFTFHLYFDENKNTSVTIMCLKKRTNKTWWKNWLTSTHCFQRHISLFWHFAGRFHDWKDSGFPGCVVCFHRSSFQFNFKQESLVQRQQGELLLHSPHCVWEAIFLFRFYSFFFHMMTVILNQCIFKLPLISAQTVLTFSWIWTEQLNKNHIDFKFLIYPHTSL